MNYFTYQYEGSLGRVWSLFNKMGSSLEEGSSKPKNYEHTYDIVKAAMRGSIRLDDYNLENFNLDAYERGCLNYDELNKYHDAEKVKFLVDEGDEEAVEGHIKFDQYPMRKIERLDEGIDDVDDACTFEDSFKELMRMRKFYIVKSGVDIVRLLLNTLKGVPEVRAKLLAIVNSNEKVKELIGVLCETCQGNRLINLLEEVV